MLIHRWPVIPNTVVRTSALKYIGSIINTNPLTSSVDKIFIYIYIYRMRQFVLCVEFLIWISVAESSVLPAIANGSAAFGTVVDFMEGSE